MPTPLIRQLLRTVLVMAAITGILSAAVTSAPPAVASDCLQGGGQRSWPHRATFCDLLTHVGVDLLNDRTPMPLATGVDTGSIYSDRVAKFHIYALMDDPRYYANVTFESCAIQVKVSSPQGGGDVPGRVYYTEASNLPLINFEPTRPSRQDRVVFLDFSYHCKKPSLTYTKRFTLLLRGVPQGVHLPDDEDGVPGPAFSPAAAAPDHPARVGQFEVGISPAPDEVVQAHPFAMTLMVTNQGSTGASPGRISFRWPGTTGFAIKSWSQVYTSDWYWRLGFFWDPGPIAPGATATLVLTGTPYYPGEGYLEALGLRVPFTIRPEPRPDLAGSWEEVRVSRPGVGLRRSYALRGRLRVSNDGLVEAPASRVLILLSDDLEPGPEDRLLGISQVVSLPAGGAEELNLAYDLRDYTWNRDKYVLAVVDVGNSCLEPTEEGNLAAFGLLPPEPLR